LEVASGWKWWSVWASEPSRAAKNPRKSCLENFSWNFLRNRLAGLDVSVRLDILLPSLDRKWLKRYGIERWF
jgi:hypothetical protein